MSFFSIDSKQGSWEKIRLKMGYSRDYLLERSYSNETKQFKIFLKMLRKPVWKNVKYLLIRRLREMRCLPKWHSLSTWTLLITFRTFHVGPISPYKIVANLLAFIRTCNVVSKENRKQTRKIFRRPKIPDLWRFRIKNSVFFRDHQNFPGHYYNGIIYDIEFHCFRIAISFSLFFYPFFFSH